MNFLQALQSFHQKAFDYHSRSRRSEFWWLQLAYIILAIMALSLDVSVLGFSADAIYTPFVILLELAFLIPTTTLTARRLHDVGLTGWAQLPLFMTYLGYVPGLEGFPYDATAHSTAGAVLVIVFAVYCLWLLINLVADSHPGTNKYGPSPKG